MLGYTKPSATVLVIFGAGGDLARRKLIPAMYNLSLDQLLPDRLAIIGLDRKAMTDDEFRRRLREGVDEFSRRGKTDEASWNAFAPCVSHIAADFDDLAVFFDLANQLAELDKQWNTQANHLFYLAVPPVMFDPIAEGLGEAGLGHNDPRSRLIVEKPFGRDLESARSLNQRLTSIFDEPQIFRIDHYLGKETVQNILAFRFANSLFEPIWNRRYKESFPTVPPEAYETLLLDVMLGDATQFMRADQLEEAWQVITPILEAWQSAPPSDFPNYEAGTWGPREAEALIAQDGRSWAIAETNHTAVEAAEAAE